MREPCVGLGVDESISGDGSVRAEFSCFVRDAEREGAAHAENKLAVASHKTAPFLVI